MFSCLAHTLPEDCPVILSNIKFRDSIKISVASSILGSSLASSSHYCPSGTSARSLTLPRVYLVSVALWKCGIRLRDCFHLAIFMPVKPVPHGLQCHIRDGAWLLWTTLAETSELTLRKHFSRPSFSRSWWQGSLWQGRYEWRLVPS